LYVLKYKNSVPLGGRELTLEEIWALSRGSAQESTWACPVERQWWNTRCGRVQGKPVKNDFFGTETFSIKRDHRFSFIRM